MFKHRGEPEQFAINRLKWLACYAVRVITNCHTYSNWHCSSLVVIAVHLCLSQSLCLANLEFHCPSVSLSSSLCTVPSAIWVFPLCPSLFPLLHGNAMSNIWGSQVFYAVISLWHDWLYKPYLENQWSLLWNLCGMVDGTKQFGESNALQILARSLQILYLSVYHTVGFLREKTFMNFTNQLSFIKIYCQNVC